jgi:glycine/D-amino acid oxidase-like deaminating enzyme
VLNYYRLSADKRLLFGARLNYLGDDPAVISRRHRRKIRRLYPVLADVRIDFAWGGRIGVPYHRTPVMGRSAPNVFYSQGYAGHGVNVTHLAGQLLAEAVAGTMERFDVFAGIRPLRIPGARRFSAPLVTLAVLYYQLRDRL